MPPTRQTSSAPGSAIRPDLPEVNDLTIGIMALVAQAEREPISRRTKEALAIARSRGVRLGKRLSKLDPHRSEIDGWLDSEPSITAVEVLARLRSRYPDRFTEKHLRSTQRLVRAWRADQAKRVIRCGTAALEARATVTPAPAL